MRRIAALATAATMTVATPVAAEAAPMPRQRAVDHFDSLWQKCRRAPYCIAGRRITHVGVRFKWVSEDGNRRHWGTHAAYAGNVAARIRRLRARMERASTTYTIPAYIVACESQGNPRAVNPSNPNRPAGLYQIITSTWLANGGGRFAPTADRATPWQQGVIAARIWNGGRGAGQWECA